MYRADFILYRRAAQNVKMGARVPANRPQKKLWYSKELKSSIDCCVNIQEALALHYTGLKAHFGDVEIELQIANAILCEVSQRLTERMQLIGLIRDEANLELPC